MHPRLGCAVAAIRITGDTTRCVVTRAGFISVSLMSGAAAGLNSLQGHPGETRCRRAACDCGSASSPFRRRSSLRSLSGGIVASVAHGQMAPRDAELIAEGRIASPVEVPSIGSEVRTGPPPQTFRRVGSTPRPLPAGRFRDRCGSRCGTRTGVVPRADANRRARLERTGQDDGHLDPGQSYRVLDERDGWTQLRPGTAASRDGRRLTRSTAAMRCDQG
jgi:hypothetical protein